MQNPERRRQSSFVFVGLDLKTKETSRESSAIEEASESVPTTESRTSGETSAQISESSTGKSGTAPVEGVLSVKETDDCEPLHLLTFVL